MLYGDKHIIRMVRVRLSDDLRHNAKSMKSELIHYRTSFSPAQQAKIKSLIDRMLNLAESLASHKETFERHKDK